MDARSAFATSAAISSCTHNLSPSGRSQSADHITHPFSARTNRAATRNLADDFRTLPSNANTTLSVLAISATGGLFFGAAVEEVMNLVVLPLSALHARGPYGLQDLILGLLVHVTVVGLPIAYSVRRFAK